MPYRPQPWGAAPSATPRPPIPATVRATHYAIPKDWVFRGRAYVAYILATVVFGAACYGLGRHDSGPAPEPVPIPTPDPPTPHPPKPVGPLRVVIVYDASGAMTRQQLNVLSSTAVRAWLSQHCAADPDKRPAWRVWDKDVQADGEPEVWRKAWATAKPLADKLPAVVIFRGDKAQAYPLPDTEAATIDLLTKHGS